MSLGLFDDLPDAAPAPPAESPVWLRLDPRDLPQLRATPELGLGERITRALRAAASPLVGRTDDQVSDDALRLWKSGTPDDKAKLFDQAGNLKVKHGTSLVGDVKRGADQLHGTLYGLTALGADAVGAKGTADWALDGVLRNQAEAAENPPEVGLATNIGKGLVSGEDAATRIRQALTYGREAIGENLPLMAGSLGAGKLAQLTARRLVARAVAELIEKQAAEEAAKLLAKREVQGKVLGTLAANSAQEAGSIYSDMATQSGVRGPRAAAVAAVAGVAAGTLDSLGELAGLRRMSAGKEPAAAFADRIIHSAFGEKFLRSGLGQLSTGTLEQVLTETPTEYLQTAIEQAAQLSVDPQAQGRFWETFLSPELAAERREAGIKGGTAGGGTGLFYSLPSALNASASRKIESDAQASSPVPGLFDDLPQASDPRLGIPPSPVGTPGPGRASTASPSAGPASASGASISDATLDTPAQPAETTPAEENRDLSVAEPTEPVATSARPSEHEAVEAGPGTGTAADAEFLRWATLPIEWSRDEGEGEPQPTRSSPLQDASRESRTPAQESPKPRPRLLNVQRGQSEILAAAAHELQSWPEVIKAADGGTILLQNPEFGRLSKRTQHLVWNHDLDRLHLGKAAWLPNVLDTLRHADERRFNSKSGNHVYVRHYEDGIAHVVIVRADGLVMRQGPFEAKLITQFPEQSLAELGSYPRQWQKGIGQPQGVSNRALQGSPRLDARPALSDGQKPPSPTGDKAENAPGGLSRQADQPGASSSESRTSAANLHNPNPNPNLTPNLPPLPSWDRVGAGTGATQDTPNQSVGLPLATLRDLVQRVAPRAQARVRISTEPPPIRDGYMTRGRLEVDGTITLYARALFSRTEARETLVEELGHLAARDPKLQDLVARLKATLTSEEIQAMRELGYTESVVAEEALMRRLVSEDLNAEQRTLWAQLKIWLADFCRRLTGKRALDSDVRDLLRAALKVDPRTGVIHHSVADRFRDQLNRYRMGEMESGTQIQVGHPGVILLGAGVPDAPIFLRTRVLTKATEKHGVPLFRLYRLPEALNDPLFVFRSRMEPDAVTVLTELRSGGENLLAALHFHPQAGGLEVTEIASVYGKPAAVIGQWIQDGLTLYHAKEKAREWLAQELSPLQLRAVWGHLSAPIKGDTKASPGQPLSSPPSNTGSDSARESRASAASLHNPNPSLPPSPSRGRAGVGSNQDTPPVGLPFAALRDLVRRIAPRASSNVRVSLEPPPWSDGSPVRGELAADGAITLYARGLTSRAEARETLHDQLALLAARDPKVRDLVERLKVTVTPADLQAMHALGHDTDTAAGTAVLKRAEMQSLNSGQQPLWEQLRARLTDFFRRKFGIRLLERDLHQATQKAMTPETNTALPAPKKSQLGLMAALIRAGIDAKGIVTADDMERLQRELKKPDAVKSDAVLASIETPPGLLTVTHLKRWLDDYLSYLPPKLALALPKLRITVQNLKTAGRYGGNGMIDLASTWDLDQARQSLFHELTHWVYVHGSDWYRDLIRTHFETRTAGESVVQLKGYPLGTIGKLDQWYTPYAGRIYPDGALPDGSEVPTCYMELMALSNKDLADGWNVPAVRETLLVVLKMLF